MSDPNASPKPGRATPSRATPDGATPDGAAPAAGEASAQEAASGSLPPLFAELPEPFARRYDREAPWALLGDALDEVLAELPSDAIEAKLSPDVHLLGDRIAVGRGTRIAPGAVIEGPVWIGRDVEIRPGCYIRGGCWIGDGAVVGASTEVKRAILLPRAHAPHLNYVGDSVLGVGVNLGAGTILSNFRHDGREIVIRHQGRTLATGRRKLGAILGDGVLTGCNSVLNPGCVVGRGTQIYTGVQLRGGIYPADSMVKLRQQIEVVEISG
jgi:UDP-N-acetylglucosamine diphosphorylase / glucose-1-phosphate thymidylyltransferase / UDP-N-acetylgalactosamine diphosphorylase / glucosamine-1-phosphate N-acetyltransferase / galactosamine-1-phosphate N-acetyltransferase